MLDVAANDGWLATVLRLAQLMQMVIQARWVTDSGLRTLPYLEEEQIKEIERAFRLWKKRTGVKCVQEVSCLPELLAVVERDQGFLQMALGSSLDRGIVKEVCVCVRACVCVGGGVYCSHSSIPLKPHLHECIHCYCISLSIAFCFRL